MAHQVLAHTYRQILPAPPRATATFPTTREVQRATNQRHLQQTTAALPAPTCALTNITSYPYWRPSTANQSYFVNFMKAVPPISMSPLRILQHHGDTKKSEMGKIFSGYHIPSHTSISEYASCSSPRSKKLFAHGICNGTIGVILALNNDGTIKIAFPTTTGIQEVDVQQTTQRFYVSGARACRRQFPLQNAFALTVHKTQGLTLPTVCLELDETIFACCQAYIAISRAKSWDDIAISSFRSDAFKI